MSLPESFIAEQKISKKGYKKAIITPLDNLNLKSQPLHLKSNAIFSHLTSK